MSLTLPTWDPNGLTDKRAVGTAYSVAVGYDNGSGIVKMIGYNKMPGGDWTEGSDLQDEDHVVQIASPNSSDRFGRYPKVSQGNWTHGERQLVFTDSSAYYTSNGMETTATGALQVLPSATVAKNATLASVGGPFAMVTDGANAYVSIPPQGGTYNAVGPAGQTSNIGNANNPTIYCMIRTPAGIFAGTSAGIYLVNTVAPNASTLWTADVVSQDTAFTMAYYAGLLYYIKAADHHVYSIAVAAGASTSVLSPVANEQNFAVLVAGGSGLCLVTTSEGVTTASNQSIVYTFNGTAITRVDDLNGIVVAGCAQNNTIYLLALLDQANLGSNPTLYSLSGSSMTQLDDTRFIAPDFQTAKINAADNTSYGYLAADERFIYIGWIGFPGLRYDPVLGSFSRVGRAGVTDTGQRFHGLLPTTSGLMDLYVNATAKTYNLQTFNGATGTGSLTTSYYDFSIPSVNKMFLTMELEVADTTVIPLSAITASYRLDNDTVFHAMPVTASPNTNVYIARLPVRTKGSRIQFRITLTGVAATGQATPAQLRSYSVLGMLGRVWHMWLGCRRDQATLDNSGGDPQGINPQQLIANLVNLRLKGSGYAWLWVPDSTDPAGDGSYVDTVTARVEDVVIHSAATPAMRQSPALSPALEGDVELTLTESL